MSINPSAVGRGNVPSPYMAMHLIFASFNFICGFLWGGGGRGCESSPYMGMHLILHPLIHLWFHLGVRGWGSISLQELAYVSS